MDDGLEAAEDRTPAPKRDPGRGGYVWKGAAADAPKKKGRKERIMDKPWKKEEFSSLLDTLRRHSRLGDALLEHNKIWKTGRTRGSAETKIKRDGLGGFGNFLRSASARQDDAPMDLQVKRLVDLLRRKPSADVGETCNDLDISPKRLNKIVAAARAMSVSIEMPTNDRITLNVKAPPIDRLKVHRLPIEPVKGEITFAVASDLHLAAKLHRGECLKEFVDTAMNDFGVKLILNPGDIFAGMNMYHGQLNEVTGWGVTHQLEAGVKGLPRRRDLRYKMIGGNHDESFMKSAGTNIIDALAQKRDDVQSYGFYSAMLDLVVPGAKKPITIELHHPSKAGAYALSYHMQKEIEQIPPGMKPQLLFMGHTHQVSHLPDYRGIAGFLCGTFEDQTLFLKRMHASPNIGGWIVKAGLCADGSMKTLTTTWVRYFHSARGSVIGMNGETGEQVRLEKRLSPG